MTLPCRISVAGAELELLVLAADERGCMGVDLDSGALVRATHPFSGDGELSLFDVATGQIAEPDFPPDVSRPELVELAQPPRRRGRIHPRRAQRYLQPLLHPAGPLLGFAGASVPYWTLAGDRPSVALVEPEQELRVRWSTVGFLCRFGWHGVVEELPLGDRRLARLLEGEARYQFTPRDMVRLLGYRARRLLIALSPPHHGYCYKVVAALLPGG